MNDMKVNNNNDTFFNQICEDFCNFNEGEYDILQKYSDKIRKYIIKPIINMIYSEVFPYIVIVSIFFSILILIIFIQFFIILFQTQHVCT